MLFDQDLGYDWCSIFCTIKGGRPSQVSVWYDVFCVCSRADKLDTLIFPFLRIICLTDSNYEGM